MKWTQFFFPAILILPVVSGNSQFTRADSLRGTLTPERSCYDVKYYDLNLRFDTEKQWIGGYNEIVFDGVHDAPEMQVDLFENMVITAIERDGKPVTYRREHNAVFIESPVLAGNRQSVVRIYYQGNPTTAKNPPWDGGFTWKEDTKGNPFVGVACEGIGASLWWPNKDHLSDEPDSMTMSFEVRQPMICVSNGTLEDQESLEDDFTRYHWKVHYPINNYNVTVNIGTYAHFQDVYVSFDGDSLDLDYYVLPENLKKARKHFQQVQSVLEAYEYYFGKYPFWKDGYCLVETPYLGMEHQSAIAYGNDYRKGYFGTTMLKDMDWDYIIVHETAHEYWGNAVSVDDHAEMWLHESFSTYMEALFVEFHWGKDVAQDYMNALRPFITNKAPIIGPPDVNFDRFTSSDHYMKGAWVLHTFRHTLANDSLFFATLRTFYDKFAYKVADTDDFLEHVNTMTGKDFGPFFRQYLYRAGIPALEYHLRARINKLEMLYRWKPGLESGFDLPVQIQCGQQSETIIPGSDWKKVRLTHCDKSDIEIRKEAGLFRTRIIYPENQ